MTTLLAYLGHGSRAATLLYMDLTDAEEYAALDYTWKY